MKITYKCDYALKAILELAINYKKGLITIKEMAQKLDIPQKFLEQVLMQLKKGKFVESRRGKVGGYLLAKAPNKIKLGDVIRFIEGPLEPIACVKDNYKRCKDIKKCVFRGIWQDVSSATSEIVDNTNFEDLINKTKTMKKVVDFSI